MGRPSWPRLGRRGHVSTGRSGGGATVGETSATVPAPLTTPVEGVPGDAAVVAAPGDVPVAPAATVLTAPATPTTLALVSPAGASAQKLARSTQRPNIHHQQNDA